MVFMVYGLSNFIASFFSGPVTTRLGKLTAVQWGGSLSILALAGLVNHHSLGVVMGSLVLLAIVQGIGVTALNTTIVNLLPAQRSTLMACNSAMLYLGLTVSSGIGGWAYARVGFSGLTLTAMGALLVAVGLTQWLRRRLN